MAPITHTQLNPIAAATQPHVDYNNQPAVHAHNNVQHSQTSGTGTAAHVVVLPANHTAHTGTEDRQLPTQMQPALVSIAPHCALASPTSLLEALLTIQQQADDPIIHDSLSSMVATTDAFSRKVHHASPWPDPLQTSFSSPPEAACIKPLGAQGSDCKQGFGSVIRLATKAHKAASLAGGLPARESAAGTFSGKIAAGNSLHVPLLGNVYNGPAMASSGRQSGGVNGMAYTSCEEDPAGSSTTGQEQLQQAKGIIMPHGCSRTGPLMPTTSLPVMPSKTFNDRLMCSLLPSEGYPANMSAHTGTPLTQMELAAAEDAMLSALQQLGGEVSKALGQGQGQAGQSCGRVCTRGGSSRSSGGMVGQRQVGSRAHLHELVGGVCASSRGRSKHHIVKHAIGRDSMHLGDRSKGMHAVGAASSKHSDAPCFRCTACLPCNNKHSVSMHHAPQCLPAECPWDQCSTHAQPPGSPAGAATGGKQGCGHALALWRAVQGCQNAGRRAD